jgi:meso-butanediol dehydrogenase / (S,S)-butanediol dehydrogenase / diacetyl reductase
MVLRDKVAVVTGAGRGLGRGIALRFAKEGAHLALVDIDRAAAEAVAAEIRETGGRARVHVADVSDATDAQRSVVKAVEEYGRIDILVNNAGKADPKAILDITPKDWDELFNLNTRGLFFCLQEGARQMVKQGRGGKIINMGTISAKFGNVRHPHYGASKAAVISITYSAALLLAPYKINVNAMCPGIMDTQAWVEVDRAITTARGEPAGSEWKRAVATVPLGRAGTPADVAGVATFLASPDSDYVTGQTINVDGGIRQD